LRVVVALIAALTTFNLVYSSNPFPPPPVSADVTEERGRIDAKTVAMQELALENKRLRDEPERPGLFGFIQGVAAEAGLTFGWVGFYFTFFTVVWNGYTPGKRLLGIRVRRLDGKAMTWWYSFERFGGYAAGVATGLLGFFQIYWDANRQAVHDKIAKSVVILERG